jgi:anti-anti-sigma factor
VPLLTAVLVRASDQVVVRLRGEADLSTVGLLADALLRAAGCGTSRVVVDVAGATFWDCSGLHTLADFTAGLARAGRQCRIVAATRATRRLIALADFAPLLVLDGPLHDPGVARAAESTAPPLPEVAPAADLDPAPRAPISAHPAPAGRRADGRVPAGAIAARHWR